MEKEDNRSRERILTFSDSVMSNTGFGTVMKELLTRLTADYEIYSVGIQHYTSPLKFKGVMCLPTGTNPNIGGADIIPEYMSLLKPKYFITCTDLHQLGFFNVKEGWIKYITIDAAPIHRSFHEVLRRGYLNIVPNKFAYDALRKLDVAVKYIPFGVDTGVYRPGKEKEFAGLRGKFIFGAVARNTERKRWDRLLRAFSLITRECKDAVLVCITDPREQLDFAFDAQALAKDLGTGSKVFFPTHASMQRGLTNENMAGIYNAFDIHINVADREAFGLPILESMSCGVPNIVNDYSAPPEIVSDAGIVVEPSDWTYHSPFNYRGGLVDIKKLAKAMRLLYDDGKMRKELGKKSRERALKYDWNAVVVPQWLKLLEGEFLQEL